MIRYALACSEGHEFEAWFRNSVAFDEQRTGGSVVCPVCGSGSVEKRVMAPAVAHSSNAETMRLAAHVPAEAEALAVLRKLRARLTRDADYVGKDFAAEARRIHYEEAERRGIYGEATADEARGLAEEGIDFQPLPPLPEDHN
jgi:hypothetical protein